MFNIETQKFQFGNALLWVDFGISILLFLVIIFSCVRLFKRKIDWLLIIPLVVATLVTWFFGLRFAWTILIVAITGIASMIFVNMSSQFNTIFKGKKKNKIIAEKIYDKSAVTQKVSAAVQTLAKSKTGALITIEKQDRLNDVVKSGTILNAPISPELLTTIFYPGTRLHDGAVVIRLDEILAASVYYTPTTKPLTGKYGSRHRAALGISEKSDSVTIVVSEETGRISIAYKGELTPVAHDNFLRILEEYLAEDAE